MSELDKLTKKRAGIKSTRAELLEQIRAKKGQIGVMATTSKADPSYSSAKLDTWQRELTSLEERLQEIEAELAAIDKAIIDQQWADKQEKQKKTLFGTVVKLHARADGLQARRQELAADLEKTQAELASKRSNMGAAIMDGGDAGKLGADVSALEDREAALSAGIQAIDDELLAIGVKIKLEKSEAAIKEAQKMIADLQGEGLQLLKDTYELRDRARRIAGIGHDIDRLKAEHRLESASLYSGLYSSEAYFAGNLFDVLDRLRRLTELKSPEMLERAHIKREF